MLRLLAVLASMFAAVAPAAATPVESFPDFIRHFEWTAVSAGISPTVYEEATRGVTPDPTIKDMVIAQPEFATPIWEYIDVRVTDKRIANGRAGVAANAALFEAAGKTSGVDPYLLAAIWGIETNYGTVLDNPKYIKPIIRSLATLVWQRRGRLEGDTADFIAALKLVQRGPRDAQTLLGSWAGAIGHLQVNPSNVILHGTDGDGDGRIDLHGSLADALATTAKYLLDLGYQPGLDWGYEVELPATFDYALASRDNRMPISAFADMGVRRVAGREFSDTSQPAFLYVPAGKDGPKFLLTANYLVLKGYNRSDSYALTLGYLTDRLKGEPPLVSEWPRSTTFPNLFQRHAIQEALIKLGYLQGTADGLIGPMTQAAYAKFQTSRGEVADGFVTAGSYDELVKATNSGGE
jgi:membrane-bound lytic murein transglycosylase B